jgi:hypothetical protein
MLAFLGFTASPQGDLELNAPRYAPGAADDTPAAAARAGCVLSAFAYTSQGQYADSALLSRYGAL